jgi:hypothetical protein
MIARLDVNRGITVPKAATERISRVVESLKESASKVAFSASIITGSRSTVWGGSERDFAVDGSVRGEPLSPEKRSSIAKWSLGTISNAPLSKGRLRATIATKEANMIMEEAEDASESDSDFMVELIQSMVKVASANFNQALKHHTAYINARNLPDTQYRSEMELSKDNAAKAERGFLQALKEASKLNPVQNLKSSTWIMSKPTSPSPIISN